MKNSFNDIDNFLRDSFEDFSSEPSSSLRASISASVRKFNFFRFNPLNFNIFYLVAIILGTGTILSFASGGTSSENGKNIASLKENIFQPINIQKAPKSNDKISMDSNNKIASFNNQVVHNDIKLADSQNIFTTISENSSTQNHITETSHSNNAATAESIHESFVNQHDNIVENYTTIEKNIIFDTIIEEEKSTIIDTVNIEVRKTVEIKRKRKSLR